MTAPNRLPDPLLSAVSEMADDEIIRAAREAFARAADAEPENRRNALDDVRFVGLDDLWPEQTPSRTYTSGTLWCFWRWTTIDSEYLTRLHVLKTPWFAICVHWIKRPDPEPFDHDHPVSFLSVIVHGGYVEMRNGEAKRRRCLNVIKASLEDRHTIIEVLPNTVTLCLMGPKIREWGFHTPSGWRHWKDYYAGPKS